jgi:HAD domain family 1 in Swiss Army Knife RNA repair proteins
VFNSPLPNPKLWNGHTIGFLQTQETFTNGGWWHDSRILAATGEGVEKEEPRGWEGWWNEQIIQLIKLSMDQKDALSVMLTGRSEEGFSELIKRMLASRGMDVDMVVLKPKAGPNNQRFSSTMGFKQVFLEALIETYKSAEEIRVYEDRIKHVKGFREFFMDYNKRQNGIGGKPTRGPITAEVIQVADGATLLDPVVETAEVQRLISDHNLAVSKSRKSPRLQIKKTVFYTGYLITNTDTQKLLTLAQIPPNMPDTELKFLANNVLITPRPCPNSILEKVGGMGNRLLWEVTGTACFENKIWAASVRPVPQSAKYYTENPVPIVVLAVRKGAKPIDAGKIQNWQPVPTDKAFIFETVVGEKVLLRIEEEDPKENEYESLFPNKAFKRKHAQDDDSARQQGGHHGHQSGRGGYQQNNRGRGQGGTRGGYRGNDTLARGYRGASHRGGNAGAGGRGRGRGGGGGHNYRSLDDVPTNGSMASQQSYNGGITYDDFPQQQQQQQQQNSYVSSQQMGYSQQQSAPQQYQSAPQQYQQQQQQYQQYSQYQHQPPPQGQGQGQGPGQGQQNGNGGLPYY